MQEHPVREAPNYTNAALAMAMVNLFCWLVLIWAAFGYGWALALAFSIHLLIRRLG